MIRRIMKFFTSMSSLSWPKSREKALKVFYFLQSHALMGKKYPPPKSGNFRDSSLVTGSQPLRLKENTSLVNSLQLQIKGFSANTWNTAWRQRHLLSCFCVLDLFLILHKYDLVWVQRACEKVQNRFKPQNNICNIYALSGRYFKWKTQHKIKTSLLYAEREWRTLPSAQSRDVLGNTSRDDFPRSMFRFHLISVTMVITLSQDYVKHHR